MKVLQFLTQMEAGGAQGRAINIQDELNRRGHTVETVFLYIKRPAFVGRVGTSSLYNRPLKLFDGPILLFRIWKKIRDFSPDVVMTFTHWSNVIVGFVAFCTGCKVVVNQTNPPDKAPRMAYYMDCAFGWAGIYDINITNSKTTHDSMAKNISKRYRRRLRIARLGVCLPRVTSSGEVVRARLQIPQDVFLLVHAGRLSKSKNHEYLLRAVALLPQNIHLACAGDGELKEDLHSLAENLALGNRMHWLGEMTSIDLADLLNASDLFVFPSLFEGFGLAPIEAASMALPLLVSDIPIFHEVMTLGDGRLVAEMVPATNPEAIAEGVRKIVEAPALQANLKERSALLAKKYSLKNMVDDYEQFLHELF